MAIDLVANGAAALRADVELRVRRFSMLRSAERALAPSTCAPLRESDLAAVAGIREQLRLLANRVSDSGGHAPAGFDARAILDELDLLDDTLRGYRSVLLERVESHSLAQLRASLSIATDARRSEVEALLELCITAQSSPARFLHVVDFILTLLCTRETSGVWIFHADPANLNEALRDRCAAAPHCNSGLEATIVSRFQHAAEMLASEEDGEETVRAISNYKQEIANFYYVPSILRCVIGYNAAARNHFSARIQQRRDLDAEIDDEMLVFGGASESNDGDARESMLEAHEYPGILAVQEAIARRIIGAEVMDDPAARIAAAFDIDWLEEPEREAFRQPDLEGVHRLVRMSVVLGHLATVMPDHTREFAALSLHASQLDTWICRIGEEVQTEMNELIREHFGGAQALADVKSRFLSAVLIVARRRRNSGRRGNSGADEKAFERDASELVREYLLDLQFRGDERMFIGFMGGGWRRSVGFAAIFCVLVWLVASSFESGGPREVREFSKREAHRLSPHLSGAYRDHAESGSMFIAKVAPSWNAMSGERRKSVADEIVRKLRASGVEELLLFDEGRMLQAHYQKGAWRTDRAWAEQAATH